MGRNTLKCLNSLYKIMNKGGRAPFFSSSSLSLSFFLSFSLVCRVPPSFFSFLFYSIAPSLHGSVWVSSNGPGCVLGLAYYFFGTTLCLSFFLFLTLIVLFSCWISPTIVYWKLWKIMAALCGWIWDAMVLPFLFWAWLRFWKLEFVFFFFWSKSTKSFALCVSVDVGKFGVSFGGDDDVWQKWGWI